jgi:hypothetical protein
MQNITMNARFAKARTNKFFAPAVALLILIVIVLVLFAMRETPADAPSLTAISASALEQQHGLRVNLVAVTGAGGFVDLRLKIVDGEKAKAFLADRNNFPALLVNDNLVLNAPEDTKTQEIRFNDDGNIFILYVNSANAVKPGSQVKLVFGDMVLDPVDVIH